MIKFFKRILTTVSLSVFLLILLISCGLTWMMYTTEGAKFTYQIWRKFTYLPYNLNIKQWEGNFIHGISLKNIDLSSLPLLPIGSQVKVQQVDLTFKGFSVDDMFGKFTNARLLLPGTDPLVVQANIEKGLLTANVYANTIDIGQISGLLPINLRKGILTGFVTHIDLVVKGDLNRISVDGKLIVDRIKYYSTIVSDGPGELHLVFIPPFNEHIQIHGIALMTEGKVQARRIALDLNYSQVTFKGKPDNMLLDIHASTNVDKVTIDVGFKGTLINPEMVLSSDPPMSSDVLLMMLATGKSFAGSSPVDNNVKLSGQLVSDFIDYSIKGGQGGSFSKRYGLNTASVQYDDASKRIGLRQKITEDLRIGVEIEQMPYVLNHSPEYSRKLEGEVDVTEHVSFNVSQKVLPRDDKTQNPANGQSHSPKGESEIFLKYQNRF